MADLIEREPLLAKMWPDGNRRIVEEAPAVNRWVSCSERVPNEDGEYLVCGRWHEEKPKTWICQFIIFGDIGGFANHAKNPPISFWMKLPEPPGGVR